MSEAIVDFCLLLLELEDGLEEMSKGNLRLGDPKLWSDKPSSAGEDDDGLIENEDTDPDNDVE
jgi:hypothetical protein